MTSLAKFEEAASKVPMASPGAKLAEARKKAGLSQDEVAQRLCIRRDLIAGIEQDRFQGAGIPSATFMRGYLRGYARIVRISEDNIVAAYDALHPENINPAKHFKRAPVVTSSSTQPVEEEEKKGFPTWILLILALLMVVVGLVVFQPVPETNASSEPVLDEPETLPPVPEPVEPLRSESVAPVLPEPSVELAEEPVPAVVEEEAEIDAAIAALQGEEALASQPTAAVPPELPVEPVVETLAPVVEAVTEVVVTPEVILTCRYGCWVRITSVDGEVLAEGTLRRGTQRVFSGGQPLNAIFGGLSGVEISVNGQPFDLTPYRNQPGEVRLKLGNEG